MCRVVNTRMRVCVSPRKCAPVESYTRLVSLCIVHRYRSGTGAPIESINYSQLSLLGVHSLFETYFASEKTYGHKNVYMI